MCGSVAEHVDHIQPPRLGGEFFEESNLQGLCVTCHMRKTQKESLKD